MFYLVGISRTSSLGGGISSNPEKTALRRQGEGYNIYRSFAIKGRESEHQKIIVNLRKPDISS